jgi:hypothetical protein
MRYLIRFSSLAVFALMLVAEIHAQVAGGVDRNASRMAGIQSECAIAKNPLNKDQLFMACNNAGPGMFAARSDDMGATWTFPDPADKTIGDGDANQGPLSAGDPTLAWDTFGNLFITYLGNIATPADSVQTILSTDGGLTFTNLATFTGSVDQPTVTAGAGAVWIVWNQSGSMRARGASVTGLGVVAPFNPMQNIPGTAGCSYGDVAISPTGVVVQVCQTPTGGEGPGSLLVSSDADGLGPGNFGATVVATTTNVGGLDFIPAQNVRSIDAEAGLAYDYNQFGDPTFLGGTPSPHFGRLYLVYTEEPVDESNDTDIMVRFSDNNGGTWSAPVTVNDVTANSQFLPKIASNPLSGNIAVCWHDARNSVANNTMQEFCSIATRLTPTPVFFASALISGGTSTGTGGSPPPMGFLNIQYGDYEGLAYFQGFFHPAWSDNSNSTGDNPDPTKYDGYTDAVTGGPAAMEGDPHITTVDGTPYDFQGAGEYVSLRDGDGMQIQTRQSPVATSFFPGPNDHTGLASCVSLNTAVAAWVAGHRVTFEPNLSGIPDPSSLQLRVDSALTTLTPAGLDLGAGGHIEKVGDGISIDFPNGTSLLVTPAFWSDQGAWYLNVNVSRSPALEGIMGPIPPGSWLPLLPDGSSMGPRPTLPDQRYADLYGKFGEAWRVSNKTSLFDYAPGTSTATFTLPGWPKRSGPCTVPERKPVEPLSRATAEQLCRLVVNKSRRANCVFDVTATGHPGFAKTYLLTQQIEANATVTNVYQQTTPKGENRIVSFIALVKRKLSSGKSPTGTVQFLVDGKEVSQRIKLDSRGRAMWRTSYLEGREHRVAARYTPSKGSTFLASSSFARRYVPQ